MGVTNAPVVAPAPKGIIDPNTGKPVGADDAFFGEINNELADKGFLVTSTDELITWARTGSLMWMTFGLACWGSLLAQSLLCGGFYFTVSHPHDSTARLPIFHKGILPRGLSLVMRTSLVLYHLFLMMMLLHKTSLMK